MKKNIGFDCVVCEYCAGAMTTTYYHSAKYLNSKRHKDGVKIWHSHFKPGKKKLGNIKELMKDLTPTIDPITKKKNKYLFKHKDMLNKIISVG